MLTVIANRLNAVFLAAILVVAAAGCAGGPASARERISLSGPLIQGGLVLGQTEPGAVVNLDGIPIMVDPTGAFGFGFDRDYEPTATLSVRFADGSTEQWALTIEQRDYDIQRIDGLPDSKVTPRTPEQIAHIQRDQAKKRKAREITHTGQWYREPFIWPVTGRISGVFGSQRVLNGKPKRPHYGLDVAAPTGTAVKAPAGGVVRLAETDMYFEGGLIFLDHGHGIESAFLHLSRVDVEPGDQIAQGDVIGAVGSTGRSTGPHLHWSIRWAGQQLDPAYLVPPMEEAE
ncbi:MAG: M23 family metallopeptidase [Pseudomonadota bacterium]